MKSWKAALGLGVACAVCCAIPLLGIAGVLAATGSTLMMSCADELLPLAVALLAAALAVATVWRRRQASRCASCGCADTCSTNVPHVSN